MPFLRLLQSPTRMAGHPLAFGQFSVVHGLNTPGFFNPTDMVRLSDCSWPKTFVTGKPLNHCGSSVHSGNHPTPIACLWFLSSSILSRKTTHPLRPSHPLDQPSNFDRGPIVLGLQGLESFVHAPAGRWGRVASCCHRGFVVLEGFPGASLPARPHRYASGSAPGAPIFKVSLLCDNPLAFIQRGGIQMACFERIFAIILILLVIFFSSWFLKDYLSKGDQYEKVELTDQRIK